MYIFTGEGILNVLSDNLEVKCSSGHFRSDDKKHYNDDQNHSPDKIAYISGTAGHILLLDQRKAVKFLYVETCPI